MPHAAILAFQSLLIRVYSDNVAIELDRPARFGHRLVDFTKTAVSGIADPRIRLQWLALSNTHGRIAYVGIGNALTHPFATYSA